MSGRDRKRVAAAALLMGAAALAWPRTAHAQFGAPAVVTVPGSVTSDQAAEASLADIDTSSSRQSCSRTPRPNQPHDARRQRILHAERLAHFRHG